MDSQVMKMEKHFTRMENSFHPGAESHSTLCSTQDVSERHPGAQGRVWEAGTYPGPQCSCRSWCHAWRSALGTKSFMKIREPKQRELLLVMEN